MKGTWGVGNKHAPLKTLFSFIISWAEGPVSKIYRSTMAEHSVNISGHECGDHQCRSERGEEELPRAAALPEAFLQSHGVGLISKHFTAHTAAAGPTGGVTYPWLLGQCWIRLCHVPTRIPSRGCESYPHHHPRALLAVGYAYSSFWSFPPYCGFTTLGPSQFFFSGHTPNCQRPS